jgi:8-oxo-dGTP pyrophosphatase MutT (NUDIX family)
MTKVRLKPTFYTIAAVARYKDKYLILRRAKGRSSAGEWNAVTGHVKEAEEIGSAALRELKEETNLKGVLLKIGKPFAYHFPEQDVIVTACLIEVSDVSSLKVDPKEHDKLEWEDKGDTRIDQTIAVRKMLDSLNLLQPQDKH